MVGLLQISLTSVERVLSIQSVVEISLLIVMNSEQVKVSIFKVIISSSSKANIGLVWEPEGSLEESWWDHELTLSLLLAGCDNELPVKGPPNIITNKGSVSPCVDTLATPCSLALLWGEVVFNFQVLKFLRDFDKI